MFANYAKYYELFNQDKPYKKEIEFVHKWAGKPSFILDIACGTANYWKHYPENTHLVGIEKSKSMIDQSKYSEIIFPLEAAHIRELDFICDFELATCLFDAINYMPSHKWWMDIPIKPDGFFIFDIFDKEKVEKEGFRETVKTVGDVVRTITPLRKTEKTVELQVKIADKGVNHFEQHKLFIWSHEDIENFCGNYFEIVEVKKTKNWQTFYKCRKK